MILRDIEITGFRNIIAGKVIFDENLNIVYGANASGKTNFLEAIFFLLTGRSFRNQREAVLINNDREFCRIVGRIGGASGEVLIEIAMERSGGKHIKIDGSRIERLSDLLKCSAVISVTPEDIEIISGPPEHRRRFMDALLSHCYPSYLAALILYNKALRQKNSLLRDSTSPDRVQMKVWNRQLAEYGGNIYGKRKDFVKYLSNEVTKFNEKISSGERVSFEYRTNYGSPGGEDRTEALRRVIDGEIEREIRIRRSVIGPHRDDLEVFIEGVPIRDFGSRGQQRCTMLSMKLASLEFMESMKGEKPLLLLDEAVSELDLTRSGNLINLSKSVGQVIMASSKGIEKLSEARGEKKFLIENGKIKAV